jgi:hypothetical protein
LDNAKKANNTAKTAELEKKITNLHLQGIHSPILTATWILILTAAAVVLMMAISPG